MTSRTETVDVETFAQRLPSKHLACRRLGHTWRPQSVTQDSAGFIEVLACSSCRTRRIDELSLRGHVVTRRYQYADGYQATGVTGGVMGQRDLFRLEALIRLVDKGQAPDVPKQGRARRLSIAR